MESGTSSTTSKLIWGLHVWLKENWFVRYKPLFNDKSYADIFEFTEKSLVSANVPEVDARKLISCIDQVKIKEHAIFQARYYVEHYRNIFDAVNKLLALIPSSQEIFLDWLGTLFTDVVCLAFTDLDTVEDMKERSDCRFKIYVICWRAENSLSFKIADKLKMRAISRKIRKSRCIRKPSRVKSTYADDES